MREDKYTNGICERRTSTKSTSSISKKRPLKITTVGDGMVGKTCLLITYKDHDFPEEYVPTVFDNFPLSLNVDEIEYDITLWDTAGQEDYERLRPLSYPNTDCFLLCFSIGNRSSFDNIVQKWYPELNHHCPNVPIILIGTKSDLREKGEDVVSFSEGKKLKRKIHAAKYMECSALRNQGLDEIFVEAVKYSTQKKQCCIFL